MIKFLKYTLATFVGVVTAFVFLILIAVLIIFAVSGSSETNIEDNSVLVMKLQGEIIDNVSHSPLENISPFSTSSSGKTGLVEILKAIKEASADTKIKGILLRVEDVNAGTSTLKEIRDALQEFKSSGKFILSYSDFYSQRAYYLASVADRVYMNPEGYLLIKGVSLSTTYFKTTLEKLGVQPQFIRHGKYKSAIEIFSETEMSKASRYQLTELITDFWSLVKNEIAASRLIDVEKIDNCADSLTLRTPERALALGFIDDLKYYDQIISECKDSLKIDQNKDISSVALSNYIENMLITEESQIYSDKSQLAIIIAQGDIIPGEGDNESIGSEKIARLIRAARKDSLVKAIVLRINSGGGSALASEVIWREVKLAAEQKTLVVSMGDAAASGGYYIASPADFIVADPTTITGSIGVFGVFMTGKELLNKLGVSTDVVKTNKNADFGSFSRPVNDMEIEAFRVGIEKIYDTFITHVAEGRKMTKAEVDSIAQGRVWTGMDALEIGLVDTLGGLNTAIKVAVAMENLEDNSYYIKYYPERLDPIEAIMKDIKGSDVSTDYIKRTLGDKYMYYQAFIESQKKEGIVARLPFDMEIQ